MVARAMAQLAEFFKDQADLVLRDADAGVAHLHPPAALVAPAAQQNATLLGIADGVGNQVANHARQQHLVGVRHKARAVQAQAQAFLLSRARMHRHLPLQQLVHRKVR